MAVQPKIPPMGFGTFGRTGESGVAAILVALETGYRHLDTAQGYDTERENGEAVRRSGLGRENVFVTTKISGENCVPGKLGPSLEQSLANLGMDYVDLTLIHWPVSPQGELPMPSYLEQLAAAQERGLTRLIGVSNFTIAHFERAVGLIGEGRIATNQFERHPYLQNQRLVDACTSHGIATTCYLPLARGRCAGDPVIEEIAERHAATPHQIALAFSLAEGHIVIPTSGKPERIRENFGAAALQLSDADLTAIRGLDRGERQINPGWSPAWD